MGTPEILIVIAIVVLIIIGQSKVRSADYVKVMLPLKERFFWASAASLPPAIVFVERPDFIGAILTVLVFSVVILKQHRYRRVPQNNQQTA